MAPRGLPGWPATPSIGVSAAHARSAAIQMDARVGKRIYLKNLFCHVVRTSKAVKCILTKALEGFLCIVNFVLVSKEPLVTDFFFALLVFRFLRMIIHDIYLGGRIPVNLDSLQ